MDDQLQSQSTSVGYIPCMKAKIKIQCIFSYPNLDYPDPRLSGTQNHLACDTWIMQLSHQRTYTVYILYSLCIFSRTCVSFT